MKSGIRSVLAAFVVTLGTPSGTFLAAEAQALERFSPEYNWLISAMPVLDGYVEMLLPIYDVAGALAYQYGTPETYAANVQYSVERARGQINMLHENNIWLLGILTEPPAYKRGAGGDLIRKIGDLKARSEDIRIMTETVLRNIETSVSGDELAFDTAMREAAALIRHLSSFAEFQEEFALLADADNHPVLRHIHTAEKATLESLYRLWEAEILTRVSYRTPEFETAMTELTGSVALMRRESRAANRMLEDHLRFLKNDEWGTKEAERNRTQEALDTEKARADLIRDLEMAIYHLLSETMDVEAFRFILFDVHEHTLKLDPAERRSPSKPLPRPERTVNPDRVH